MKIGTYLRKLRDNKSMSTRQVAEKMGVSASTYMDWELDKTSPSLKSYIKLTNAFDVCPVEMMAYFLDKVSEPMSSKEKTTMEDIQNMIAYYRDYSELLKEDKSRLEKELLRVQELLKHSPPPEIDGQSK